MLLCPYRQVPGLTVPRPYRLLETNTKMEAEVEMETFGARKWFSESNTSPRFTGGEEGMTGFVGVAFFANAAFQRSRANSNVPRKLPSENKRRWYHRLVSELVFFVRARSGHKANFSGKLCKRA